MASLTPATRMGLSIGCGSVRQRGVIICHATPYPSGVSRPLDEITMRIMSVE